MTTGGHPPPESSDLRYEWMDECRREHSKPAKAEKLEITRGPWQSHPKRMLRHKA